MKDLTLAQLEKRAEAEYERVKERQRENYRYAKSLGFSTQEAVILQSRSKELILKLSQEKFGDIPSPP